MKQFLAFVRKEFYHISRDRRTLLILLVMPIVQIILFGFAISTELKNVRVAILDPVQDLATERITERLGANRYFTIVNHFTSPEQIDRGFQRGEIDLVLRFEERFNEHLLHAGNASIQLIADGTDPNAATMMTNYATQIITAYQQEINGEGRRPMTITPQVKLLYNPQMEAAYNFVPGVMGLIMMMICAMMTAVSIVREKERGTMEVLLVSPVRPIVIILAKVVPYLTLSYMNLVSILLLSVFVLGVPIAGSLVWLTVLSLLFISVALALGLLISSLVDSQVAAMIVSGIGLMMPVVILSGMLFPIESMPLALQWLSRIIPARWFIAAVRKIMIQGVDVQYAWREMTVLVGMAVTLIFFSLKKFKKRLE